MMARPSKSIKLSSKNLTQEEIQYKGEMEDKLKGKSNKLKAPEYLTTFQKKIFNKIVDELAASDILGNLDIWILETCAIAIDRMQDIESMINEDQDLLINKSLMSAKDKYTKDFFRCCNELCLSPQSRAKLGNINIKAQEDEDDPLLKIIKGGRNAN
jgi:P27 family predicted phage terminase small subunit